VTQLTDSVGNVVEKYAYDIFGKAAITNQSNSPQSISQFGNRFQFTGREWLCEVGLYDYRNRVYSCELGRFLQIDPIRFDAGDVNLYRYAGNRAIYSSDPYGLFIPQLLGALAGGAGAYLSGGGAGAIIAAVAFGALSPVSGIGTFARGLAIGIATDQAGKLIQSNIDSYSSSPFTLDLSGVQTGADMLNASRENDSLGVDERDIVGVEKCPKEEVKK
jgi:RHS repeat-associated protein